MRVLFNFDDLVNFYIQFLAILFSNYRTKHEAEETTLNAKIEELSKSRDVAVKEVADLKLTLKETANERDKLRTSLDATQAKLQLQDAELRSVVQPTPSITFPYGYRYNK